MTTLGTLYIVCGILYIIACVMDGQDVKPLWKKWVGGKLEKAANYFFPIKYVTETKYIPLASPTPWVRCDYEHTSFEARKIQCVSKIYETDIADELLRYGNSGINLDCMIAQRMKNCMNSIFDTIRQENIINFDVDRESDYPNILVRAWLHVGKKR